MVIQIMPVGEKAFCIEQAFQQQLREGMIFISERFIHGDVDGEPFSHFIAAPVMIGEDDDLVKSRRQIAEFCFQKLFSMSIRERRCKQYDCLFAQIQ